ncbi:MAG: tetratricopeptide repeat protein [Verrucomicrobiota bacterium]
MRPYLLSILIVFSSLHVATSVHAEETLPLPANSRLPNIQASINDGFYALAEQQARGVLRDGQGKASQDEAVLLLAHALWGQKRYSEMLGLLKGKDDEPGHIYWRARAYFELKQYPAALEGLSVEGMEGSPYIPASLRLMGHIEQLCNRFENAETLFLQFAEEYPDHPDCVKNLFDLAEAYVGLKKIPEAIATYEALSEEQDPYAAQRAKLKLANLLHTRGAVENFDVARNLLFGLATNVNTRLAYRIDAFIDLAALEEKRGGQAAAVTALQQAVVLSPDARQRVPVKLSLARMLLRNGDVPGALKLLEECRAEVPNETLAAELQLEKAGALLQARKFSDADGAYQVYLDVAGDADGVARAWFGKGLALWELGRFAESAAVLDKAAKGLDHPDEKADALFKAGDAYYRAENFSDAEKRYRAFVADFPANKNMPNALYQQGVALAKTDRRTEALAAFHALEENHADSPFAEQAALRSADVMRAGGQYEAALAKYTQIGQAYTNSSAVAVSLHQRGMLLYQLGRYAEAQQAFETVIASFPDSEYAPQATYMRGFCLYVLGEVDEAVETCKDFIKQYPDLEWTPEVVFWLAEQYYNQGDYGQAEPLFMRVASEFKGNKLVPRAFYRAGRAAAAQANYVKAIERYSVVAKKYPDAEVLPQTRFAQGDALSELGEFARAVLAFDEIIKNYPESHLVNAAWGRKGDCQFSLAVENPARYAEAMNSYQMILGLASSPMPLKLQAEYKVGRCLEKTYVPEKAFSRYMNVVHTFIVENVERSPYSVMWFTRSAFGAAALKEKEKAWLDAVVVYDRVIEANVPAKDEAAKRIKKIKNDNWLLFEQAEER